MGLKIFALTALGLMLTAPQTQASPAAECGNQAGSQVEIGNCLLKVTANVDATIKQMFGFATEAARDLDTITKRDVAVPALSLSQDTWTTYRDKHCNFVGSMYGGGSGAGIAVQSCRITLGRARVDTLMQFTQ